MIDLIKLKQNSHYLSINDDRLESKEDLKPLEPVFIETPLILIPYFSLLSLSKCGRACGHCGEVIKAYDGGIIKSGEKKELDHLKHERFVNGLDCDQCNFKWCCLNCKEMDNWHEALYHRPINKSNTTNQTDYKEVIYWNYWIKLEKFLNTAIKFSVFKCILNCFYNERIKKLFEELPIGKEEIDAEEEKNWGMFTDLINKSFKTLQIDLALVKKYVLIFRNNNYDGSIYVLFSNLKRSSSGINCRIDLFSADDKNFMVDEFKINENNSSYEEESNEISDLKRIKIKPIWWDKRKSIKKLIQCKTANNVKRGERLVISEKDDYSNPVDKGDNELLVLDDKATGLPKIVISHEIDQIKMKKRRTSMTSSGASFGEGIIKYNREQIREMLKSCVLEESDDDIEEEEEEDDNDDEEEEEEEEEEEGKDDDGSGVIEKMKHLTLNSATRRKSVRFVE